jgi:hypothetical protein
LVPNSLTIFSSFFLPSKSSSSFPCTSQGSYECGSTTAMHNLPHACSYGCGWGLWGLWGVRYCRKRPWAPDTRTTSRVLPDAIAFGYLHGYSGPLTRLLLLLRVCGIWVVLCRDTCDYVPAVSCVCLIYVNVF